MCLGASKGDVGSFLQYQNLLFTIYILKLFSSLNCMIKYFGFYITIFLSCLHLFKPSNYNATDIYPSVA